jgi:nitrate/nitrite transporter NarK
LALNCLLLVGNYYAYDNPAALRTLLSHELQLKDQMEADVVLGLMYSVYSLPNIILPFFSGYIMDRLGPNRVLLALSSCVCLGQLLVVVGISSRSVSLTLLGRTLFGIGGESVSVAQSCITTKWFQHKELAFALGLNLAVPRLGSVLTMVLSPWIAAQSSVQVALLVGFGMCVMSTLCAVILVFGFNGANPSPQLPVRDVEAEDLFNAGPERTPLLLHYENPEDQIQWKKQHTVATMPPEEGFIQGLRSSLQSLPATFWWLCLIVILIYGTIVPFNIILSEFLQQKWTTINDSVVAGRIMGIPDTICAFLVSVCGYIVDRHGRRASWLIVCSLMIMTTHLMLAFGPPDASIWWIPISPLVLLGFAYSFYGVAFWSAIACIFEQQEIHVDIEATSSTAEQIVASTSIPSSPILNRAAFYRRGSLEPAAASSSSRSIHPPDFRRLQSAPSFKRTSTLSLPAVIAAHAIPHANTLARSQTIATSKDAEPKHLALAYGLSTSAMNLSLTVVPLIIAAIRQYHHDFVAVELYFAAHALMSAFVASWLLWRDGRSGNGCLEKVHYVPEQ